MEIIKFEEEAIFPTELVVAREENIKIREMLYNGKESKVFLPDFLQRLENNGVDHYSYSGNDRITIGIGDSRLQRKYEAEMQGVNVAKPVIQLFADLLFSEGFQAIEQDEEKNEWLNGTNDEEGWIDRINFQTKCHKGQIGAGQRGNAVFKVYQNEDGTAQVESIPATNWIPLYNTAKEKEGDALVYRYKVEANEYKMIAMQEAEGEPSIIRVTEYYAGQNIYKAFICDGNKIKKQIEWDTNKLGELPAGTTQSGLDMIENTGYMFSMLQTVTNDQIDNSIFGVSDLSQATIECIRELTIRQTQIARILDKNSDPGMYGPANQEEIDARTGERIVRSTGKYIPVESDDTKPAYITWEANLEANYKMQDQTMNYIYQETGTNAAALAATSEGIQVISGAALEKVLMRPLSKVKVKKMFWTPALKRILRLAYEIETGNKDLNPKIIWFDGLPNNKKDDTEVLLLENGGKPVKSHLTSIMQGTGMTREEAQAELSLIEEEQGRVTQPNIIETPIFGQEE